MKLLLFILLFNSFEYGQLAHLPGYYTINNDCYQFKPCYEDENRFLVDKSDITLMVDYLEDKHDTKLNLIKGKSINVWSAVIRKNGKYFELSIVCVTADGINYIVEVFYAEFND